MITGIELELPQPAVGLVVGQARSMSPPLPPWPPWHLGRQVGSVQERRSPVNAGGGTALASPTPQHLSRSASPRLIDIQDQGHQQRLAADSHPGNVPPLRLLIEGRWRGRVPLIPLVLSQVQVDLQHGASIWRYLFRLSLKARSAMCK